MALAPTRSGNLHYELTGDGPEKVLLIMGFGSTKEYWDPIPSLLSKTSKLSSGDRYQVCTFDNRGFGKSPTGNILRQFSTGKQAEDILFLLSHLGWISHSLSDKKFLPNLHIVGWSMGGMISLELILLLLDHPSYQHQVCSISIISSSAGGFRWHKTVKQRLRHFLKLTSWIPFPVLRNFPPLAGFFPGMKTIFAFSNNSRVSNILPLHHDDEWLVQKSRLLSSQETGHRLKPLRSSNSLSNYDKDIQIQQMNQYSSNRHLLLDVYRKRAPFDSWIGTYLLGMLGHLQSVVSHFVSNRRLTRIQQSDILPLVVTGEMDRLVNPRNSFHLARILKCQLIFFPKSGHMVHVEHPTTFAQLLDQHFRTAVNRKHLRDTSPDTSLVSRHNTSYASFQNVVTEFERAPFYLRSILEYTPFFLFCYYLWKRKPLSQKSLPTLFIMIFLSFFIYKLKQLRKK